VQNSLLQPSVDPTAPLFPAPHELRPRSVERSRAVPLAEAQRHDTDAASIHADSVPISERFCSSLALSALLAFGSAPLLAHAATVESHTLLICGLCCVVAAIVIQISERRRAVVQLTQAARARGLDHEGARQQARATLALWLS
jgi:hypothetical protein